MDRTAAAVAVDHNSARCSGSDVYVCYTQNIICIYEYKTRAEMGAKQHCYDERLIVQLNR